MCNYRFVQANSELFANYNAVYSEVEFDMCYNWNERTEHLRACNDCYFLYRDNTIIGGVTIAQNNISNPFMVAPFSDRELFWNVILQLLRSTIKEGEININSVNQEDVDVLLTCGAIKKWSQLRMNRPTDLLEVKLVPNYELCIPKEADIPEIVTVVYNSHVHGFTSEVYGKPDISDVEIAIKRRFVAFKQTDTLHFSTVVKEIETSQIVGVCIAGIYPDSSNNFSTINQVSVLPEHRGKGIAKMVMSNTITTAHSISPVIGLGALAENPAVNLYRKLGFTACPSFTDLRYKV